MMHAFLRASSPAYPAGGNRGEDVVQTTWVKHMRDIAFDIEDCLLDFICCSRGLRPTSSASLSGSRNSGPGSTPSSGAGLFGRRGRRRGTAGCPMLYDDPYLFGRFDRRAWVTVPHQLEGADEFGRLLQEQIGVHGEERCLLVVDDVSSLEEWEHVLRSFAGNDSGGRFVVLVTTHSDEDYDYEVENNNAIVSIDTEYSSQELGSGSKKSRPSTGQSSHAKAGSSQPSKDKASEKEVIDVDKEPAKDQGRREIASRSEMWKHFTKVKNAANVLTHGRCNYCHRPIKADTKLDGTSALKRHFNICKRNPHLNRDPTQPLLQRTPGEAPVNFKFDPDALKKAFAQMIIEDELPFAFGEKSGFRKFMAIACPRFNVPSRRTTTRDALIV
ncbi:hypothetical protein ACQ4PT_018237 [Festuca glaucescens]